MKVRARARLARGVTAGRGRTLDGQIAGARVQQAAQEIISCAARQRLATRPQTVQVGLRELFQVEQGIVGAIDGAYQLGQGFTFDELRQVARLTEIDALAAIESLRTAAGRAQPVGDAPLFLRAAVPLLELDGDDALAVEAAATAQRIAPSLHDQNMRRCFENALPRSLLARRNATATGYG